MPPFFFFFFIFMKVKALFISDVHLGSKGSQAKNLLEVLTKY